MKIVKLKNQISLLDASDLCVKVVGLDIMNPLCWRM